MPVFFQDGDYKLYLSILAEEKRRFGIDVWAYCLMTNHVHLIVCPHDRDALSLFFRESHRRYTRFINRREGWSGHLWQDRFASLAMDEKHALMAARYIENNPVEAGIVKHQGDYRWSSAPFHLGKIERDVLVATHPLQDMVSDWQGYLDDGVSANQRGRSEKHSVPSIA